MESYIEVITKIHIEDGYSAFFTLVPNPEFPELGMILSYKEDCSDEKEIYFPRALIPMLIEALSTYKLGDLK